MQRPYRLESLALCAIFVMLAARAQGDPPADQAWWPQFHGPNRDNISTDTGLLKQWTESGPRRIWTFEGCGNGYSSVAIADGRIFTVGDFEESEQLVALDLSGRLLWRSPNGKPWNGSHPGARTTPTYDDGVLYHLNPTGRMAAFEAESGRELWAVDLIARFGGRYGTWAMAENLLVTNDHLLCVPGGQQGLIVAFNKQTGEPVWVNTDVDQTAAYCSPTLSTFGGVRQLITVIQKSVVALDVETGKLLWSHPRVTRHDQNVTMPVAHDGKVFVTSGHLGGGELIRIATDLHSVQSVWSNPELDNCHGGMLLLDGHLYGSGCRKGGKAFFCAEFETGKVRFVDSSIRKLSLTCADGMIYGIDERGQTYLIQPSTERLQIVSRFNVPKGGHGPFFAHPVVCAGRLYIRHAQNLYAYDVKER